MTVLSVAGPARLSPLPDEPTVPPHFAHAVQRDGGVTAIRFEGVQDDQPTVLQPDVVKPHTDGAARHAVEIHDPELGPSEFRIPLDAVQQLVDRDHRFAAPSPPYRIGTTEADGRIGLAIGLLLW
jgi:hypothetical protein